MARLSTTSSVAGARSTRVLWDNNVWLHNVVLLGSVLIDRCYSTRFSLVIFQCTKIGVNITQLVLDRPLQGRLLHQPPLTSQASTSPPQTTLAGVPKCLWMVTKEGAETHRAPHRASEDTPLSCNVHPLGR